MGRKPLRRGRPKTSPPDQPEELELSGSTAEQEMKEPITQTKSAGLSSVRKAEKNLAVSGPRRSERIKSGVMTKKTTQDKDIERVIEDLTLREDEKDEEPVEIEEVRTPEPSSRVKSLEEKVEYLLQQYQEQQKAIDALNLKVGMDSTPTGSPVAADLTYKNLYIDSQKKNEALTNENHQLSLKLQHALGKLEAYENGASAFSHGLEMLKDGVSAFSSGLGNLKDVIVATNPTVATKTEVNGSSPVVTEAKTGAKRKKGAPRE